MPVTKGMVIIDMKILDTLYCTVSHLAIIWHFVIGMYKLCTIDMPKSQGLENLTAGDINIRTYENLHDNGFD
ncbi:hypothetical protein RJT34_15626 [Clitoria ternatea]|uniref:Uncharacterized protein n=1 Tax=Clitoria ternatea TaxID=43366 RepID=A0AAN9PBL4_CLITE